MSAIIDIDSLTATRTTTLNYIENEWSKNIRDRIVQFNFQTVRCNKAVIVKMDFMLYRLLYDIKLKYDSTEDVNREEIKGYLIYLYKLIGYTRDIVHGKGEYAHSYMHIHVWYKFFPELAKYALLQFVESSSIRSHPYGSWKDIKYFCLYCKNKCL